MRENSNVVYHYHHHQVIILFGETRHLRLSLVVGRSAATRASRFSRFSTRTSLAQVLQMESGTVSYLREEAARFANAEE